MALVDAADLPLVTEPELDIATHEAASSRVVVVSPPASQLDPDEKLISAAPGGEKNGG